MASRECTACNDTYALSAGLDECAHGMCWPCASAELDRVNVKIRRLREQITRLNIILAANRRSVLMHGPCTPTRQHRTKTAE